MMSPQLPEELRQLKLGGYALTLHAYQALVLSERTESRTHITSQNNLRGQVARVDSHTTTERSCWLRYFNGIEVETRLPNLPVREGQVVTLIALSGAGLTRGTEIRPLAVANLITKQWNRHDFASIAKRLGGYESPALQGLANGFVLLTLGLGLIPLLYLSHRNKQTYVVPLEQRVAQIASWALTQSIPDAADFAAKPAAPVEGTTT